LTLTRGTANGLLQACMSAFEVAGKGKNEFALLFLSCADHVAEIENHAARRALRLDDSILFFDRYDRFRRRHKVSALDAGMLPEVVGQSGPKKLQYV
jgi:hypothetical protein